MKSPHNNASLTSAKAGAMLAFFVGSLAFASTPTPGADKAQRTQEERVQILRTERDEIAKRLREAEAAQPGAKNRDEADKAVSRLQGDLKAIENELQRVEGQKPVATGLPPSKAASAATEEKKPSSFNSWDVFKNFGK